LTIRFIAWSEWQQEGDCSASCGGGTLKITRICSLDNLCPGQSDTLLSCNTEDCPG